MQNNISELLCANVNLQRGWQSCNARILVCTVSPGSDSKGLDIMMASNVKLSDSLMAKFSKRNLTLAAISRVMWIFSELGYAGDLSPKKV